MGNPLILIVDDDDVFRRIAEEMLTEAGYEIMTAADGQEALDVARQQRPDVIITDVMMPGMDGWTLIQQLRALPDFAMVPVIFLTGLHSAQDRIRGFRLGADDYWPKPFNLEDFEELPLRVSRALQRSQKMESAFRAAARAPKTESRTVIGGKLDQIGLPSVLTLLEMERKTGVLAVERTSPPEKGRIYLREGRIMRAEIDSDPDVKNEAAVYHILGWSGGKFQFRPRPVETGSEVQLTTTQLLLEGARRLDESSRSPDEGAGPPP